MSVEPLFTPHQIVRLHCDRAYLYAEVIQLIESKNLCWARPLLLWCCDRGHSESLTAYFQQPDTYPGCRLYDLRQLADLLWPTHLFQPVLDTEAIPLLTHLYHQDHQGQDHQTASSSNPIQLASAKQLRQFVDQVWQSNMEQFKKM
ncbi:MAG: hypothetical protein ACTS2F_07030 [Thainema sp.]